MILEFERLRPLLRRRADDVEVTDLIGQDTSIIKRDEYYGSVEFRDIGIEFVFKEAPWVVPVTEIFDPKALHVCAFHFHREGHEGHSEYSGHLPGGVAFNDSEVEILRKLGRALSTGGGGMSSVLKRRVPRWLRYSIGDAILQFQLDGNGRMEMVTLYTEDLRSA